jgi:hypothetical protein
MAFILKSSEDVMKFALPLYDYLYQNGYLEEAKSLNKYADGCFTEEAQALEAYRKAYSEVRENVRDLPPEYKSALDAALRILSAI